MGTTPDNQTAIADIPVAQLPDQSAPSWPLTSLPSLGELFYYSVTAYNAAGESERSNTVEYSFEVHGIPQWLEEQGLRIVQNAGNINVSIDSAKTVDLSANSMNVDIKGEKIGMRIK
jgi:hypothetical protein